jgi:glutathione S-transferase
MSLIFYYSPMSTSTMTEIALAELDVPCEKIKVDTRKGDTRKPDYLKLNPNGKVPLIVHDGTPIWESSAIAMYLGEVFGVDKKLYPAAGPKRGEAMKWIVWTNVTLGEAVVRWTHNTVEWVPADQHNANAAKAARDDITGCLRILDQALEGKSYLLGDYTLADTHLHAFTQWLRQMQVDFTPHANIEAWNRKCSARPGYTKVMASAA